MRTASTLPLALALLCACAASSAQTIPHRSATPPQFTFHIPVNEAALRFRAWNRNGTPLTHLQVRDLEILDNGRRQNRIVLLQREQNLPIRAGFLFDASASVMRDLPLERAVLRMYASRLLRIASDRAFLEQFDTQPTLVRGWTGSVPSLTLGAEAIGPHPDRYDPLTAIFDTLYITCRDKWDSAAARNTGNFILLFTDGNDDASHAYLSEAVDMCQRKQVAIYAFDPARSPRGSDGYETLSKLTRETGGRMFIHPRADKIWPDLEEMEADQRNQYLLVYRPTNFRADGSFHRIKLKCLVPDAHISTRSGYYAFSHGHHGSGQGLR